MKINLWLINHCWWYHPNMWTFLYQQIRTIFHTKTLPTILPPIILMEHLEIRKYIYHSVITCPLKRLFWNAKFVLFRKTSHTTRNCSCSENSYFDKINLIQIVNYKPCEPSTLNPRKAANLETSRLRNTTH